MFLNNESTKNISVQFTASKIWFRNIIITIIIIIINSFYVDIQNNLQMSRYVNKLDYNPNNKHTEKNSSLVLL